MPEGHSVARLLGQVGTMNRNLVTGVVELNTAPPITFLSNLLDSAGASHFTLGIGGVARIFRVVAAGLRPVEIALRTRVPEPPRSAWTITWANPL